MKLQYLLLGIILLVHTIILTKVIFFPYPELFIYPYLVNSGLKPYGQILDQHFPGLMFFPINFDNLGMTTPEIARIWLIVIVYLTHILLFIILKEIFKSSSKALLTNLFYLIWQPFFEGWVLWIDSFLPLFLLPAFYAFLKRKFFIAGLFLGVGVVFKQTILPLTFLLLVYIYWQDRNLKNVGKYLFGLMLPIGGMIGYLFGIGVIKDFWYWTVIFNLTVYANSGTQIPTSFGFISRIFVVYAASLTASLYKDRKLKIILALFLIGSLLGAFDRTNFVHFQPSLPFVLIATTIGFYSLNKRQYTFILIGLYLLITIWWQKVFYQGHISKKIFFFDDQTYLLSNKIRQYTHPREKIFIFGASQHLYQMSQTLPAGDVFVFQFPWFLKVVENRVLKGLMQEKPQTIVVDTTVKIEDQSISNFASKIYKYIKENYTKIDNVNTTEILRRKS